ncbi:hypothetical protein SLS63_006030 [Diaporthe eres]|uniref:Uncharacterized protein n=1 Tax=Diaporthe eres TaxID=83184 RepID=A0ABR1P9K0_DIAER
MSESSSSTGGLPSDVAVRSKDMLLYQIGEPNRKEHQVIRTRRPKTSKGSRHKQETLKSEEQNPWGAGSPITAEALNLDGADEKLLCVIVGLLLPRAKTDSAQSLVPKRTRKLETIQGFDLDTHGSSIEPSTTDPILKVVLHMEDKQKNTLGVLCNMEDGLCESLPLAEGMTNDSLFFYPEWTQPKGVTEGWWRRRLSIWISNVSDWRGKYLEATEGSPGNPQNSVDGHRPVGGSASSLAAATKDLLSGESPTMLITQEERMVNELFQALVMAGNSPNDPAWVDRAKAVLSDYTRNDAAYKMSPGFPALSCVMEGHVSVDRGVAQTAIIEFKKAFPVPGKAGHTEMSPHDLVQLAKGIRIIQQEKGYVVE